MKQKRKRRALLAALLSVTILLSLNGCVPSGADGGESSGISLSSDGISSEESASETSSVPSSEEAGSEKTSSVPKAVSSATEKKTPVSSAAPSSKAEKPAAPSSGNTETPPESEAHAPSVPESPSDTPVDSAGITGQIEREILRLVNEERAGLGLGSLTWNNALYRSAKVRSDEMAANHQADDIDHVRPDGSQWHTAIQSAGYSYTRVLENLLYIGVPPGADFDGGDVSTVANASFNGWKESPGHYANMINSGVDEIGIAVTYDGTDIYATQHFGKQ